MQLETLRKDMVAAMKAKDKVTKEAVSSLIAAAKKVAIDEGCRDDIPEELVDRVILKETENSKRAAGYLSGEQRRPQIRISGKI